MTLDEILTAIEGEVVVSPKFDIDVYHAFSSDLMSDVLVYASGDTLLITGLTNPQAVRTAEMADIPVILFVRGKYPQTQTIKLAEEIGVALLVSPYTMFETSGLLYQVGFRSIGKLPIVRQK